MNKAESLIHKFKSTMILIVLSPFALLLIAVSLVSIYAAFHEVESGSTDQKYLIISSVIEFILGSLFLILPISNLRNGSIITIFRRLFLYITAVIYARIINQNILFILVFVLVFTIYDFSIRIARKQIS